LHNDFKQVWCIKNKRTHGVIVEVNARSLGGIARARKLPPEVRKKISQDALKAKQEIAKLLKATHGSSDHPLKIGDVKIPCYVLEDGMRVLSQRGLMQGLGVTRGGRGVGGDKIVSFMETKSILPFVSRDLSVAINNPIRFRVPTGGFAFGYPAVVLADICEAILAARKSGKMLSSQLRIADQCETLVRGFARVGIIALVDEVTGYQSDRSKDALARILEAFVAKELQPYMKTFPTAYYQEIFRLRDLKFNPENPHFRPQYFGMLTNDIVYNRIAPGLREELKKQSHKEERKAHLHRSLTLDRGHPTLRERLASIVSIMKLSTDYKDFISKLNKIHPRYEEQTMLKLEDADR